MATPLDQFSAPVRTWFLQNLGEPTPPQSQGWLPIQRGEHTLILAPTGSGKTLAAFLWGIDQLFRELRAPDNSAPASEPAPGVRLLYISPLKALNNDVERNLRVPLAGIRTAAARLGEPLPELRVAVRTGDTPSHTRAAMLKRPPHILITTPESLYLILTSPRAREMFRTVHTVIVDEIHTLCGNKRGVHLALSLERLHHLADGHVQRIGLSATITPLDEVARFLGGQEASPTPSAGRAPAGKPVPVPASPGVDQPSGDSNRTGVTPLAPRHVTVVNATYHKALDLRIVSVVDDFKNLPGQSIWPFVIPRVLQDIREHHSTLVFANNRRLAERTADRLNAQLAAEQSEEIEPGSALALAPGGVMRDRGIFAIGAAGPIRAHHGSVSKESRREMEEDLKAGKLPALIGTSSLELGIDIGSVDLVVQLQSPKSVSQGLQRVGRAGHIVGETSVGRIYPTFREDLVEAAAIVHGMLAGDVEPTYTPRNPLDVLAQQIVAMVAVEEWAVPALYDLIRRTYAYRDLSRAVLDGVLGMLSGQYPNVRARVAWDRVNDRLAPLPGSRLLAITNPGTIADTGAYQVYLDDHKTKVGELDEEFVFETHVGDTFLLGSQVWRVLNIENDRIVVGDAAGATPRMPFWKGDYPWRPYELGARIGRFRREIAELISRNEMDAALQILQIEYALDAKSAHHLVDHIQSQINAIGVMASDRTIVLESFEDALGEPRLVIHSPFGGRINGAWALALGSALRDKTGLQPETETNDDGILFHFPQGRGITPVDLVRSMTAEQAHARILRELPGSALFGAHFRMNAGRALLLPKARAQKRTPLWLQRLKARDLLAQVSQLADFPIVAETIRECLCDVLDLPHLEEILTRITRGEIQLVSIETAIPSPVASALLFQFINVYMYEGDAPKAEQQLQALSVSRELLDDLLQGNQLHRLLKPEAIDAVTARRQHVAFGYQARTIEELAVILAELGDLTTEEIAARSTGDGRAWVTQLAEQGRVTELAIPTRHGPENRWVPVELAPQYASLQAGTDAPAAVLARYLRTSGPVTRETLLDRYAFAEPWLDGELTRLNAAREIGRGHLTPGTAADEFVNRGNLEQIHRQTLSLLRKEIQPVSLPAYAAFLVRWQHATAAERLSGEQGLRQVLQQLQGIALPATVWERDVLPARMKLDAAPSAAHDVGRDLDEFCASGEIIWVAQAGRLLLFPSGRGALYLPPDTAPRETPPVKVTRPDNSDAAGTASAALGAQALAVLEYLRSEGASFTRDLEAGVSLRGDALRQALSELVTAGLVTSDSLEAYRDVTEGERRSAPAPLSALSDDLAARMQNPRALTPSRYRDARRRVARRLGAETQPVTRAGRWSLVYRVRVLGPALSAEEKSDLLARMLLTRYGILTRESLEHEQDIVEWARLYPPLERMEMRGQIRRGYFVAGLPGVQFALPEAVEALRAPAPPDEPAVVLSAVDPANLYGPERPGVPMHFARLVSTWVVQSHGRPVLVAEDGGARLTSDPEADPAALGRAVDAFLERPNAPRHVTVTQWNGDAVVNGAFETLLRDHGFRRTPGGMER